MPTTPQHTEPQETLAATADQVERGIGLRCPRCGKRNAARQPIAGRRDRPRYAIQCTDLDCDWRIDVEVVGDEVRIVPDDPTPDANAARHPLDPAEAPINRPPCRHPKCDRASDEGGLCRPHRVQFLHSRASRSNGHRLTVDAWIAEIEQRNAEAANHQEAAADERADDDAGAGDGQRGADHDPGRRDDPVSDAQRPADRSVGERRREGRHHQAGRRSGKLRGREPDREAEARPADRVTPPLIPLTRVALPASCDAIWIGQVTDPTPAVVVLDRDGAVLRHVPIPEDSE